MRSFMKLFAVAALNLSLSACWVGFPPASTTFSKQLRDADGDGFMSSPECDLSQPAVLCMIGPTDPGCVIVPNPGGCAVIEWTQTINEDGTYTTCEVCIDEGGAQLGDAQCQDDQYIQPVECWQLDAVIDGGSCWECTTPEGDSYISCEAPTVGCESDADCQEGEGCIFYPGAECPPNALCAEFFAGGVCGVVDPTLYCNLDEECPDGLVCNLEAETPCEGDACYMYEPFFGGICGAPTQQGCASDADCQPNQICELAQDPTIDPLAGCDDGLPQGVCIDVTPADPCSTHGDADSCNADYDNLCGWVSDPTVVCFTEPCDVGSCQFVGCGDTGAP